MKRVYLIIGLFLVIVVGVSTGCDKKQLMSDSNSEGTMSQLAASSSDAQDGSGLKSVFFDYNKYAIRINDKKSLKNNVSYFLKNKKATVLIEGHCDERGTDAYNLALGDRRAKAVMQYLVSAGVSKKRLKTISYGESRPLESGHDEAAWAKNRRTNFVVTIAE